MPILKLPSKRKPVFNGKFTGSSKLDKAVTKLQIPKTPTPQEIQLSLEGIYIGDKHEGEGRGKTGEFYWHTVVCDGKRITQNSHKTATGDLTVHGMKGGMWMPVSDFVLYQGAPEYGYVSLGFRLLESDTEGDKKAEQVVKAGEGVVDGVLDLTGYGVLKDVVKSVTTLILTLVKIDGDDQIICEAGGFNWPEWHCEMGRFVTFSELGSKCCRAVFSVIPSKYEDAEHWHLSDTKTFANLDEQIYETEVISKRGVVSMLMHGLGELEIVCKKSGKKLTPSPIRLSSSPIVKSFEITDDADLDGTLEIHHKPASLPFYRMGSATIDIMFTAYGDSLAMRKLL